MYDFYKDGGVIGNISINKNVAANYYLKDLTGEWEFALGENSHHHQWNNIENWGSISVPGNWESQGYEGYDGVAWYRKSFHWKDSEVEGDVVFVLGRIDDSDVVFLNGDKIGSVDQMKSTGKYYAGKQEYRTLRAYEVSKSKLKQGHNTIIIRVHDTGIGGGIYEGPVGIMSKAAFQSYFKNYENNRDLFDYLWDSFFD